MKHVDVLMQLLPPVSYDATSPVLGVELSAVGNQLDLAMANADQLRSEMYPDTCSVTLLDWERNYGLPDPCVTIQQTVDQRKAALISKVNAQSGQSRAYFIALSEAMGYPGATIDEFAPMTCSDDCNSSLYSDADRFVWQINLPAATGGVFVATCNSDCNSSLQSWGDEAIECRINKFKPAHTSVIFAYP
ncbi:MAG: YmfQ family protein [Methylomonas sp.]